MLSGPALVPQDTWIEMDERDEEDLNETDRMIRYTNRRLCEAERDELRRVGDVAFRRWCAAGYFGGIFTCIYYLRRHGVPWQKVDIDTLSAALGCLVGTIFQALTFHIAGVIYFPVRSHGKLQIAHIAWLFCWASIFCQLVIVYVIIHRRHIDVIDPGPPNQIFHIRGFFAAQLLLKEGLLFDYKSLVVGESRIPPHVIRYLGYENLKDITKRVNKLYYTLGVAPCVIAILVLVFVCITLALWKKVSRNGRKDFDLLDIMAPVLLIVSLFVVHYLFCYKADKVLAKANAEPEMVRKNIAWVLHRTPVTHSYCLWLVWRNPEAYALTQAAGVGWWERYMSAKPSFRLTCRLLFLTQIRLTPDDKDWIPLDLIYEVLAYLAEGDTARIITRHIKRRAVTL